MKDLTGIINVYKPPGITSFGLLSVVKRIIGVKKAGHGGIIDFMAQGVLPVLIGEATKLTSLLLLLPKEYEGEITLGIETDTHDIWGKAIYEKDASHITLKDVEALRESFIGKINQIPPKFSAKRIDGKRAYELAKKGKEVQLKEKEVEIFQFDIYNFRKGRHPKFNFKILCSSGTYMRSLARDIGKKLNVGGTLSYLVRTAVGKLEVKESLHLDDIINYAKSGNFNEMIMSIEDFLDFIPRVALPKRKLFLFKTGNQIRFDHPYLRGGYVLVLDSRGKAVGIGKFFEGVGELKPVRIFNIS